MVGFCNLVGTGIASVSTKTAVNGSKLNIFVNSYLKVTKPTCHQIPTLVTLYTYKFDRDVRGLADLVPKYLISVILMKPRSHCFMKSKYMQD